MSIGVTEQFCRALADITADTIPGDALAAARRLVLDGIAVGVAGTRERAPRILADHLRAMGGADQATAINFGFRTSAVSAAYLNGAAMHVLDYEPMWNPPNHATSTTLAAVLAAGEMLGADGHQMLIALIRGVEAQGRLRVASRQYEPRSLTFHPPGVTGVIGSAIATGCLFGLDLTETRNAVGLAASRAGSLIGNIGTMAKSTHCGMAAAMGLDAALMARRGFTANPDIIEAPNGFAAGFFAANWDPDALVVSGAPLGIVKPGYAVKMLPSQYATHFVILAALDARAQIPSPRAIKSVEIVGPIMPYVDRPRPTSGLDAKFSFQFAAACALLDNAIGIDSFSDQRCASADMLSMLAKVRFVQSSDIPASLDSMWVEITVELESGERITAKCAKPAGAWGAPISDEQHGVKVRNCLRTVFSEPQTEHLIEIMNRFETLDPAAFRILMHTLGNFQASH